MNSLGFNKKNKDTKVIVAMSGGVDSSVVAAMLKKDDYDNLLKTSDEWYKLAKHISDDYFLRKCKRQTSLLMDTAKDRYDLLLTTYPGIEQWVPQYHIASYLGIKPESLSRIKSLTYIKK